jgi:hypothetical protein
MIRLCAPRCLLFFFCLYVSYFYYSFFNFFFLRYCFLFFLNFSGSADMTAEKMEVDAKLRHVQQRLDVEIASRMRLEEDWKGVRLLLLVLLVV